MTDDPWTEHAPIRRRNVGCITFVAVLIVGALIVSALAAFITRLAIDGAIAVVVVAVGIGLYRFFQGPPED